MDWAATWEPVRVWLLGSGVRIAVIILFGLIFIKLARRLPFRIIQKVEKRGDEEYQKRARTLGSIISWTLSLLIIVMTLLVILGELGMGTGPLIASAGVLGLAIGFGAQDLIKDVISGFFLLLEDQLRVGDWVETSGKSGMVERITLRIMILRDLSGNVHYLRNGQVDTLTNMSKEFSFYLFDLRVAFKEDTDQVVDQIRQVDEEMRQDPEYGQYILAPIEVLGVSEFGESGMIIRARTKTKPLMQWTVGREANRRLKKRFDEQGIEIPYPHRAIYFTGEGAAGRISEEEGLPS